MVDSVIYNFNISHKNNLVFVAKIDFLMIYVKSLKIVAGVFLSKFNKRRLV